MRKRLPPITESPEALHQRMTQAEAPKKRQRVQALSGAASGDARHRQDIATLLGAHRRSVAAWFDAYAEGGIDQMRHYEGPRPPLRQRITAAALTALQEALPDPHGFAGDTHIRTWLAAPHHASLSSAGGSALVRTTLGAKPERPRPSQAQKSRERPPHSIPHAQPCSSSEARAARRRGR